MRMDEREFVMDKRELIVGRMSQFRGQTFVFRPLAVVATGCERFY